MAQYIPLPDGSYLKLKEGESFNDGWSRAQRTYPEAFGPVAGATKPESGFFPALKAGKEELMGGLAALAGRTGLMGAEAAQKEYEARQQKAKEIFAPTEAGWTEAPGTKLAELLGGSLPYMAAPVVAGLGAATLPLTGTAATVAGLGAAGLASTAQFTATNLSRQLEEGKGKVKVADTDLGAAALAAIPQAALDTVSMRMIPGVGRLFGRAGVQITEDTAAQIANQGLKKVAADYALSAGKAMGTEGLTEAAQQVFERLQAGLSITDEAARKEYFDNFVGGAVLGGALAPAGRYIERGSEQRKAKQVLDDVEAKKAAEARAAEEAKKADPSYLLDLGQRYDAAVAQMRQMQEAVKTKPGKDALPDERATYQDKLQELKKFVSETMRPVTQEYTPLKGAVTQAREQQRVAGMTPLEYQMEQAGVDLTAPPEETRVFTGEEDIAQRPAPELQYAQQQMRLAKQQDMGTYTAADYAQYLMQDPAMAQRIVDNKVAIPEVDTKTSNAILGGLKLQLKEQEKQRQAALGEQLQQQQADLAAQQKSVQTDAADLWKASLEQTEEQATEELLRPNFETLRPSGPATVAVTADVQPIQNPKTLLRKIDDLFIARDKAAAETEDAFGAGNRELGAKKAQEREAAQVALNNLGQLEGAPRVLMELRKAQDTALMNTAQLADDLRAGRTLGGPEAGTASSTPQTLINQINKQRDAFVTAAVQEAATNRKLFGKALTQDEATKAADQMRGVFNEWVTRTIAEPRSVFYYDSVVQPAQMRGTKIVEGAKTERVDPRPLKERQFGAYKAATQTLQEQLRKIADRLVEVPAEGQRAESQLKLQFAQNEAEKAAEARGETAQTRSGELRRRREYVGDLIDQALLQHNRTPLPDEVVDALRRAQDAMQKGQGGFDVLTQVSPEGKAGPAPIVGGLLDAAETLATRALTGRMGGPLVGGREQQGYDALVYRRDSLKQELGRLYAQFDAERGANGKPLTAKQKTNLAAHIKNAENALSALTQRLTSVARPKTYLATATETLTPQDTRLIQEIDDALRLAEPVSEQPYTSPTAAQRAAVEQMGFSFAEPTKTTALAPEEKTVTAPTKQLPLFGRDKGMALSFERTTPERFANAPIVKRARAAAARAKELLGDIKTAWAAADEAQAKVKAAKVEKAEATVEARRDDLRNAFNAALEKAKVAEIVAKFQPQIDAAINQLALFGKERAKALRAKEKVAAKDIQTIIDMEREELQSLRQQLEDAVKTPSKAVEPAEMKGERQLRELTQPYELAAAADEWVQFERARLAKAETALAKAKGPEKAASAKVVAEQRAAVKQAEDITKRAQTGLGLPGVRVQRQAIKAEIAALEERIPTIKDAKKKRSAENRLGSLRKALGESARPIEGEFTSEYVEELRKELRETVKNKKLSAEEREAKLKELNRKLGEVEGRRGATMRSVMERAELTQAEAAKRAEEKTAAQEALENRALAIADEIEDLRGARERARTDASKQDIQEQIDERNKELTLLQGQLETPELTRTEKRKERKPQKTLFSGRGVGSEQDLLGAIAEKIKDKKPLTAYEKRIWEGRTAPKTGLSAKGRKTLSEFSEALRRERKEATRPVGTFGETLGVEDVMSSFEIGGKDVFFSRGETTNPSTTADVRAELKQHFADSSKVKVYDTVDALIKDNPQYEGRVPDNARGFVDGKQTFLIAENIPQGQTLSVALHEVGAHIGMRETMGAQQYNASVKAIENWAKKDDGSIESRVARAAQTRVEEAGTTEAQQNDELLAYAIEEAVNAGVKPTETKSPIGRWLGQMLGMFRNALRKFGLAPKELSLQELVDTAYGAAQLELRMPTQVTEVTAPEAKGELFFSKPAKYDASVEGAGKVADALITKQKSFIERVKPNLIGLGFRTQFIDKLAPLEHVARNMMDPLKGAQMMYYLRMYGQKMNFTSQAVGHGVPQLVEKTRKDGRKEWVIESIKDTNLKDVVDVLARDDVKKAAGGADAANRLFTLYLAALRADRVGIDALNFGGKVTQAELDAARTEIEANKTLKSAFDEARDKYNAYNRKLLEFAVQTGALNKDHASKLLSSNDYIPFYRVREGVAELMIGKETPVRIGNIKDSPHLQELVGGDEAIFDFLTSSVQNTTMLLDMSLKNLAQKNVAFELADTKLAHIKKASKTGKAPVNSFEFKIDGENHYAILDQDKLGTDIPAGLLIKGLEGIPVMLPQFVRYAGIPARALRRLVTASPVYMARQLFRDSLGAYMISGSDATPVLGALKQIGKASTLEQRGVTGGQVFTGMPEDMTRILKEMQEGKPGWTKALSYMEAKSMQADALTRRAQYESYINQGLSEMEATLLSLESMNFNKRGVSPGVYMATTLIPFMNAQIQSLDVLYKAFSGKMPFNDRLKIREQMITKGLLLSAATLAYAAAMQDDDAYKNARPDEKYNNWFVRVPFLDQFGGGEKVTLRVPIPFELGYIFKALPEALYNTMVTKHGGEEATEAFTNILRQLIPAGSSYGIPQAVKPLIEVGLGKSFFTGRDIESASEQRQEPWTRYRDNTSEAAKMIGQLTNISPVKLEALISGYTGGMGLALLQSLNVLLPHTGPEKAEKRLSDMPVVGSVFQPTDASGIIDNTYKALEEATQAAASYKKLIERGEYGKAQKLIHEKLDEMSLAALAGQYRQNMGNLTKAETAVKASNMTPEKKREALDTIRQAKIQIATSVRTVLDKRAPQAAPA